MMDKNPHVELVKNVISCCLVTFSIILITGCQFTRQTGLSADVHPALAFFLLWFAVLWLSVVEGGQASLVGLAPVDRELYKESHPTAYKCSLLAHGDAGDPSGGDALDRYLLGRQFMVVFIVFTINISGGPIAGAALWGLPDIILQIFMGGGVSMILLTTMVGQLNSQVNASHCMLDYLNNFQNYATLIATLVVEFSGLVHASYVIEMIVHAMAGEEQTTDELPRSPLQNLFFFTRCLVSIGILVFAFTVTLTALFQGKTTMWEGVPPAVAVIVFFLLMSVVGLLEGMQIAFFAVSRIKEAERGDSSWAKATCALLFRGDAHNLSGFMIGRQLCVVSCMFFVARVTSLNIDPNGGETLWGVSPATQTFFNMGFLGALITTIVASIAWQLVASAFPIAFLSNPFTYIFLRICLFLEGLGICNGAYVIAAIYKRIYGYQRDEVYIGTAEERAEKAHKDNYDNLHFGAGHLLKLPGFQEEAPSTLKQLMKKDPSVREYLASAVQKAVQDGTDLAVESDSEDQHGKKDIEEVDV